MPKGNNPKLKEFSPDAIPTQTIGVDDDFVEAKDSNFAQNDWVLDTAGDIESDQSAKKRWAEQQGMWIIRFQKENIAIDNAWKAVLKGIKDGVFYQAKFSTLDENDDQVIIIYTYNTKDVDDIIFVHDEIKKRNISKGAICPNIEYKTNLETANPTENLLYTSNKIEQIKAERPSFISTFLLNVMANKELHLAAFLVISLAIVATAIGFSIMGAPLVAGAIIATGTVLGLAALGAHGFFCGRETKSLDETPELILSPQ